VHEVITLAGRGRCEIDKIQGSRFIASAGPAESTSQGPNDPGLDFCR
jgi:hypothetical protein